MKDEISENTHLSQGRRPASQIFTVKRGQKQHNRDSSNINEDEYDQQEVPVISEEVSDASSFKGQISV